MPRNNEEKNREGMRAAHGVDKKKMHRGEVEQAGTGGGD